MTNGTSTALVPVKLTPSLALLPSERDLSLIDQAAALALSGAVALPPELKTRAQVAAVMLYGLELGLKPMTAIRHLYIVNGRVSPSAEVMAGMLMAQEPDSRMEIVSLSETECTMRIIRPSRNIDKTYTVTWAEIVKAGLGGGNNAKYPTDRLRYHCTKRLLRAYAPDVINAMDGPMVDGAAPYVEQEPAVDAAELYNEGDATEGEYRHVEDVQAPPAPPKPAPAPQDELTAVYMDLIDKQGKDAGMAVMDWAVESFPDATGRTGKLDRSKLTPEEGAEVVAEMKRYIRSGQPRCADDAHEGQYDETTTLLRCSICGLTLQEEPAPVGLGI